MSLLHRKFDLPSRPRFYLAVREEAASVGNGSLESWLATCLKDSVIKSVVDGGTTCPELEGDALRALCRKLVMTRLDDATDVMAERDRVHGAVNFFGCLFAFDGENSTGIRDLLPEVRERLIERLRSRVPMVRSLYEQERDKVANREPSERRRRRRKEEEEGEEEEETFPVPGQPFARLDREGYLQHMAGCLHALDVLQCSMSRFKFE